MKLINPILPNQERLSCGSVCVSMGVCVHECVRKCVCLTASKSVDPGFDWS